MAAFDTLGAPFWLDVNQFTIPFSGTTTASGLNRFLNPVQASPIPDGWQFALRKNAPAWETGHLSLTDGATTLFQDPGDLHGLSLSWTPTGFDALTLEAGYLNEEGSLLGSQGAGAFGSLSGDTLFFGAGYNATAGDWQLGARGELGHVAPSVGQGLFIDDVSSLTTSAFHLQASRPFTNGVTLSFSLGQPLRVENGHADLSLPIGRTPEGEVLNQVLSVPLAPSGRQLDLTTKLEFPWLEGDCPWAPPGAISPGIK